MENAMDDVKRSMSSLLSEENEELVQCIQDLSNVKDELQNEVNELNEEVDVLLTENHELMIEAQNARRSFTGLQIAVSILVFVYGMLYGVVLCPK